MDIYGNQNIENNLNLLSVYELNHILELYTILTNTDWLNLRDILSSEADPFDKAELIDSILVEAEKRYIFQHGGPPGGYYPDLEALLPTDN